MRTPCIDPHAFSLQQSIQELHDRGEAKKLSNTKALAAGPPGEISEGALAEADKALSVLVSQRRSANLQNRINYEQKAWSIVMRIVSTIDNMSDKDLEAGFNTQSVPRSIQAIERLTRSFGAILKALQLEAESTGTSESAASLLSDVQLDELLSRAEARDVQEIPEIEEYITPREEDIEAVEENGTEDEDMSEM